MGLLAIACMVEQESGMQAMVGGDITYGQCVKAAKMASDTIGEEIHPPISCRLNDLHERISKFDELNETEKLTLLMNVYLGEENDEYGNFLRQHYSYEAITAYWTKCFSETKVDTYGFDSLMKRYEIPYSIWNLMASFALRGAANPAIDRYIPLDEIRAVLSEYFGSVVNVNEITDNFLTEAENRTEETPHEKLMKEGQTFGKEWNEEHSQYDICNYEELIKFTPDSTFSPGMVDGIKKSFKMENTKYTKLYCKCYENMI